MNTTGSKLSQEWRTLRLSPSGQRFKDRYWRHQKSVRHRSQLWGLVFLALGAAVAAFGFTLLFLPGPGLLLMAVGAALAGKESLVVARALDWIEVRGRAVVHWWRRRAATRK